MREGVSLHCDRCETAHGGDAPAGHQRSMVLLPVRWRYIKELPLELQIAAPLYTAAPVSTASDGD